MLLIVIWYCFQRFMLIHSCCKAFIGLQVSWSKVLLSFRDLFQVGHSRCLSVEAMQLDDPVCIAIAIGLDDIVRISLLITYSFKKSMMCYPWIHEIMIFIWSGQISCWYHIWCRSSGVRPYFCKISCCVSITIWNMALTGWRQDVLASYAFHWPGTAVFVLTQIYFR